MVVHSQTCELQLDVLVAATETGHFDTNSNSKIAQKFQIFFRERKKKRGMNFRVFLSSYFAGVYLYRT